jgi:hypothetical protein
MTTTDSQASRVEERSSTTTWILRLLCGTLLVLVTLALGVWTFSLVGMHELSRIFHGGQTHISVDQPTVVRQVRALQRLETVSYTADKVMSAGSENPILPNFLAGDRLLLVAHGEVIAGMDLAKLQQDDVEVRGSSVSVHLPQAEIFTTRLDNERTRVYLRDTGLFTSPDPNLEGDVRAEAERQIRAAALDDRILTTAEANARQTVVNLLLGLGFAHVQIH